MTRTYTIKELAGVVGGKVRGLDQAVITGVADVSEADPDRATWVSDPRYAKKIANSQAGVVLLPVDFGPTPMPAILCESLNRSIAKLLGAFAPPPAGPDPGIHPSAVIHETARLGRDCAIGPCVVIDANARIGSSCVLHSGVFIGRDTSVGDDCVFWPNVVIREGCTLGNRVIIHPSSVIGADGFGFYLDEGEHRRFPHTGGVTLGDDVEVGACTCIDRAKFGNTTVGRGTKIDNLVQLAHNVRVGEHCIFAGMSGAAGSSRIGNYCVFGGSAYVMNGASVGDGAQLAGGLCVAAKDVPAGMTVSGFPAREHQREMREHARLRRLPQMGEQLKELLARVERLEAAADHQPGG